MPSFRSFAFASAVSVLLGSSPPAQLPPGHFVFGALLPASGASYPWTGPAGLFVGHPRAVGTMWAVNGLPASLTTRPPTWTGEYGVAGLAIHPWSWDLLVGDSPEASGVLNLYRLRITQQATVPVTFGTAIVGTFALGIANGSGGKVINPAVRDQSRVVVGCLNVAAGQIGAGPMQVGELDLTTGVVTPWPAISAMFPPNHWVRAICIPPAGAFAYMAGGDGTTTCTVWQVPLPATGVPTTMTALASWTLDAFTLRWDDARGRLVVGGRLNTSNQGSLWELDPASALPVAVGPTGSWNLPAFDLEPTTGEILFAGVPAGGTPGVHHFVRGGPLPAWLCNATAAGIVGVPLALVVAPNPTPYGPASVAGTGPLVSWASTSNAGLPLVGNGTYSLRLDAGPNGTILTGLLVASAAPLVPTPILGLGVLLNLDPTPLLGEAAFGSPSIPLPIPNVPGLGGQDLYLQALTLTNFVGPGLVLGATEGAWLRIL